jgi:uncharacterized protein (TIGR03437 family)
MLKSRFRLVATIVFGLAPGYVFAHSYGPPPRVTRAPGDNPLACTSCHSRSVINTGPGSVEILLKSGAVYIPGIKQRITVRVQDPDQKRWGFELTARLNSDPEKSQAGELTPIDNMTQAICEDAGPKPCASGPSFITHTSAGTRAGSSGGASFQFDWIPPAQNAGPVTLYVAGNAANDDDNSTGDRIYTSSVELTPVTPKAPSVTATDIVSAANYQAGPMGPNSWLIVSGTNLAATTRSWDDDDFMNGGIPTSLDGVSVILSSLGSLRLAYAGYVSPTQVRVLLPPDVQQAPTNLQIRNPAGVSTAVPITIRNSAPQLITSDGARVLGRHLNGDPLSAAKPAVPGETIVVYAMGMGQTTPALLPGQLPVDSVLARLPQATIGGAEATVTAGRVSAGAAGLYELSVQVPANAANGDLPLIVQVGTANSPPASLPVQK